MNRHLTNLNDSFLIACVVVRSSQVSFCTKSLLWGTSAWSFTLLWTHSGDVRYNVCCIHSLSRLLAPALAYMLFLNRLTGWYTYTFATGFKWMLLIVDYNWRGHLPSPITSFSSVTSHSCFLGQLLLGCLKCRWTTCVSFKPPGCRIFKSCRGCLE